MKFKTKIGMSDKEQNIIRGYELMDLIGKLSFTEAMFLEWTGKLPNEKERQMMDALLVSAIEHGLNVPTVLSARIVASAGVSLNQAMAAGLLAIGKHHAGAMEECGKLLMEGINGQKTATEIVKEFRVQKKRISGYGHKVYTQDPRTVKLFAIAKELEFYGKYCKLAEDIERELEKNAGKKLCLNIDGAFAALVLELGFDYRMGRAFFAISRGVSIAAHAFEEIMEGEQYRRLEDSEVEYIGEKGKKLK